MEMHEDDIRKEKPVASVYNGSPNYVMGVDYEKDFDTRFWANEIRTLIHCILSWLFYTLYTWSFLDFI